MRSRQGEGAPKKSEKNRAQEQCACTLADLEQGRGYCFQPVEHLLPAGWRSRELHGTVDLGAHSTWRACDRVGAHVTGNVFDIEFL